MFSLNRATRVARVSNVRFFSSKHQDKNYPIEAAQGLLASVKQANGDLYAPIGTINKFLVAVRTLPKFQSFLIHPLVTAERRAAFVTDFAAHFKADAVTTDFLKSVAAQNKWAALNEVVAIYKKAAAAEKKETIAVVTTAAPLTKEELASVTKSLEKHVQKGFKLVVEPVVNPAILGGLSISMGNMHQDLTLASAMSGFEAQLEKAIM